MFLLGISDGKVLITSSCSEGIPVTIFRGAMIDDVKCLGIYDTKKHFLVVNIGSLDYMLLKPFLW